MRIAINGSRTEDRQTLQVTAGAGIGLAVADLSSDESGLTISVSSASGTNWFVDATIGNDGNNGRSWDSAFLTMSHAFSVLASGDAIYFHGKIKEQLTAPVQVFDVTIIGAANRPRHADGTPVGGESGASWQLPDSPSTTTPLLKLQQQGWRLMNFVMAGPSASSCVMTFRDLGAGNAERDSSHAEFYNIRFASGKNGIEDSGGCYNVGIFGCSFHDLTDFAIKHTAGAGVADCYRWQIKGNRFQGCTKWIDTFNPHQWEIEDNTVVEITTPGVVTSGGSGHNVVKGNVFDIAAADFDPVGGFTAHATDSWSNTLLDAIETGVPAN